MFEVHFDTFARSWTRTFTSYDDALHCMDRTKATCRTRLSAQVRQRGQRTAIRELHS